MDGATAAVELGRVLPIRLGTLRVYGDWFGRPMDNIHTAVSVEWTGNELVIAFDEGERLQVTNPSGIDLASEAPTRRLVIAQADRVRWSWYYYGRPRTAEHLLVEEHWLEGEVVKASTTANWYSPDFKPSIRAPAVEFH